MIKQNLIRNLFVIIVLAGGIFTAAGNNIYAPNGGYLGSGGGRSGYISSNGCTENNIVSANITVGDGGYLGGSGRAESEENSQSLIDSILEFFF